MGVAIQEAREWVCEVRLAQSMGFEVDAAVIFADVKMSGGARLCDQCGTWMELDTYRLYVYWRCPECGHVEDLEL